MSAEVNSVLTDTLSNVSQGVLQRSLCGPCEEHSNLGFADDPVCTLAASLVLEWRLCWRVCCPM